MNMAASSLDKQMDMATNSLDKHVDMATNSLDKHAELAARQDKHLDISAEDQNLDDEDSEPSPGINPNSYQSIGGLWSNLLRIP